MSALALIVAALCVAGTPTDNDLAPLYCSARAAKSAAPKDGRDLSADDPPKGVSETKLRIIAKLSTARDELLEKGGGPTAELETLLRSVETAKDRKKLKKRLRELSGEPLDEARNALVEALRHEKRRLVIVRKISQEAFRNFHKLPNVDVTLVDRLIAKYDDGKLEALVEAYIAGLRLTADGILDYLDDDLVGALAKIKSATAKCPDLAVAFLYLGSFSYILKQEKAALKAWRRVIELEPDNKIVRATLRNLGVPLSSSDKKKKKKKKKKNER